MTAECETPAQTYFESARCTYFPAERNHIPAHISLFHALPGEEMQTITDDIERALQPIASIPLHVNAPRSIGGGIAFFLDAPELQRLRNELAAAWHPWLSPQDRHAYRPHITVQNKVDREKVELSLTQILQEQYPNESRVAAIRLWQYLGGPWKELAAFPI